MAEKQHRHDNTEPCGFTEELWGRNAAMLKSEQSGVTMQPWDMIEIWCGDNVYHFKTDHCYEKNRASQCNSGSDMSQLTIVETEESTLI